MRVEIQEIYVQALNRDDVEKRLKKLVNFQIGQFSQKVLTRDARSAIMIHEVHENIKTSYRLG